MRIPSIHLPRRRRSVLGVDIGADGVRLVAVDQRRDGARVDWIEEISLTELQGFADYDSVIAKLEPVVHSHGVGNVDVATVPPWNSARVVIEEMPAMEAARFQQAAHWYFRNHAQEDMLDPVNRGLPQTPRDTVEGKSVIDGIMVSVDRVMLNGLADMCTKLGLRLRWVFPTAACMPALLRTTGEKRHRTLFLDIGSGQSRMILSIDGTVRLVRKLKPCANDLVREIGETLGIGWQDANHALLAHSGLGPLSTDDPEGIAARAQDVIDRELQRLAESLRGEILRSAAYVEARHGEAVDRVLLGGGLGGAPGLIERLAPELPFDATSIDPFAGCRCELDIPAAARTRFSVAAGAAALALEQRQEFDLLGREHVPARERAERRRLTPARAATIGATLAIAGTVVGFDVMQTRSLERAGDERARLEQEHLDLRVRARELTAQEDLFAIEGRVEALRSIYRSRRLFKPFVADVVSCLPAEARLDRIAIERTGRGDGALGVHVVGRTRDVEVVGRFVVELEERDLLSRIEVLRIAERRGEERDAWYEFEVRGQPVVMRQEEFIAAHGDRNADGVEVAR